jgi:hypothetical protein
MSGYMYLYGECLISSSSLREGRSYDDLPVTPEFLDQGGRFRGLAQIFRYTHEHRVLAMCEMKTL